MAIPGVTARERSDHDNHNSQSLWKIFTQEEIVTTTDNTAGDALLDDRLFRNATDLAARRAGDPGGLFIERATARFFTAWTTKGDFHRPIIGQ